MVRLYFVHINYNSQHSRQEFYTKVDDFSNWMDDLSQRAVSIEAVPLSDIEANLQDIHSLLQDHSEKQPQFSIIYENIKQMASKATPEEAKEVEKTYTELVAKYQVLSVIFCTYLNCKFKNFLVTTYILILGS